MLNAAMLSKWHVHAGGYANELKKSGKVAIKAVWDDNVERGSEWAKEIGADFEPDLILWSPKINPLPLQTIVNVV